MCLLLLPCSQVYREKVKAEVEGRPFTPPAPSALQVTLPSKQPAAAGGMVRPASANRLAGGAAAGGGDDWGDWGGNSNSGAAPASNGSFSSNSEYSRAQYMASAANKEDFFNRKMQVRAPGVSAAAAKQVLASHHQSLACGMFVNSCLAPRLGTQ
jgi:hypothetical protein